jgi:hypothetical protein
MLLKSVYAVIRGAIMDISSGIIEFDINGNKHTIAYEYLRKHRDYDIVVDFDLLPPVKRSFLQWLLFACERTVEIDGKECTIVIASNFFDVAVDGKFVRCKKPYQPLNVPIWCWIFIAISFSHIYSCNTLSRKAFRRTYLHTHMPRLIPLLILRCN